MEDKMLLCAPCALAYSNPFTIPFHCIAIPQYQSQFLSLTLRLHVHHFIYFFFMCQTFCNTLLKAHHLSQAINRRAGSDASTQCECGRAPQDAEHYLLECPLFNSERQIMLETITAAVLSANSDINISLDTNLLLGDDDTIPKDTKVKVRRSVLKFLTATCQDISI